MVNLKELFELHREEYGRFERVTVRRSSRPDFHAFLLLEELAPGDKDLIACAEHDEIWLSTDLDQLASVITVEQVIELSRCGIRWCRSNDCLALFV